MISPTITSFSYLTMSLIELKNFPAVSTSFIFYITLLLLTFYINYSSYFNLPFAPGNAH